MAHGLPDYYRGVDIAYQALSELIIRPKYGGANWTYSTKSCPKWTLTELLAVSGKGMIYGGVMYLDHTATQKQSTPMLYIDGIRLGGISFEGLYKYLVNQPLCYPVTLFVYDETNYIYAVGFSYGLTFESSVQLKYSNSSGDDVFVTAELIYALI